MTESSGYMCMLTVSCQIYGETITTSTTMVELRWLGVITGREDVVQGISSPKDALSSAEGRVIVNGNHISLNAVLGVFAPLYLSVLMEVVMGVCHDCSWIIIRSLYLGGLACRVKEPNHLGSHHQNPLISLCHREVMFNLSPQSPLYVISSSIASKNDTQVNISTGPSNAQPPIQILSEGIRPAMFFSWMLCRFLGCCYVLIVGNMLVYSFGCHFSWAQLKLDCW